jgi:hypothetical protein
MKKYSIIEETDSNGLVDYHVVESYYFFLIVKISAIKYRPINGSLESCQNFIKKMTIKRKIKRKIIEIHCVK